MSCLWSSELFDDERKEEFENLQWNAILHEFHEEFHALECFVEDQEITFFEAGNQNGENARVVLVVFVRENCNGSLEEFRDIVRHFFEFCFLLTRLNELGNLEEFLWNHSD